MGQSSSSLTPEMAEQIEHLVKDLIGKARPILVTQALEYHCPMLCLLGTNH